MDFVGLTLGAAGYIEKSLNLARQVTIRIENCHESVTLCSPSYFLVSGEADGCPTFIPYNGVGKASFYKSVGFRGTVGVLVYKLNTDSNDANKLAIMWSVPYDRNLYRNWYAIGLTTEHASKQLFKKMYYSYDNWFHRYEVSKSLENFSQSKIMDIYKIDSTMGCGLTPKLNIRITKPDVVSNIEAPAQTSTEPQNSNEDERKEPASKLLSTSHVDKDSLVQTLRNMLQQATNKTVTFHENERKIKLVIHKQNDLF